ncbi:MAG: hypothetical protein AAFV95_25040 [Bacteroidota bacterium]
MDHCSHQINEMQKAPTLLEKSLAWSVHMFTSSGLLCGFMAILAINRSDWAEAMWWLLASLVIDGIDGTFARLFRVQEVLPYMNGKTIDYVIDFATYAIIPAYFFYQAQLVPDDWRLPCTFAILLSSALYYGKEGMVSDDMYFVGFPVMWNMVVFYQVFVVQIPPMGHVAAVFFFAALHFIPIKFVYPSQASRYRAFTLGLTIVFLLTLPLILYLYPKRSPWLTGLALFNGAAYGLLAVYNTYIEK